MYVHMQIASWTAVAFMLIMGTVATVVLIRSVIKAKTQAVQYYEFQDTDIKADN